MAGKGELVKVFAKLRAGHGAVTRWHRIGRACGQLKASSTSSASRHRRRSLNI
jgi:hypothetical protein